MWQSTNNTPQAHCVLVCLFFSDCLCLCLRLPLTDSHKYEGHKEKQSGKNYVLHMPMTTTTPTTHCPSPKAPSSSITQCRPSSIDITNCGICFCACTLPGQRLMECLKCRQFRFVLAVSQSGRHFMPLHLDSSLKVWLNEHGEAFSS